jgi:thioredoxin reductase (NADPH)
VLPHLLCVPGEDLPHVSHYPADPARYVRREVLVVGGRNSAVETCLRLHHAGARITLAHRGVNLDKQIIKYWLYPEISHLIKQGLIRARFGTCLVKIEPDGATLQGPSGGEKVACDDVLLLTGYGPDTTLLKALGVVLEGEGGVPRHDPRTLETNVPGVHVCGTAVAGRQTRFTVYIENTRDHPAKIAEALARDLRP